MRYSPQEKTEPGRLSSSCPPSSHATYYFYFFPAFRPESLFRSLQDTKGEKKRIGGVPRTYDLLLSPSLLLPRLSICSPSTPIYPLLHVLPLSPSSDLFHVQLIPLLLLPPPCLAAFLRRREGEREEEEEGGEIAAK